MKVIRAAAVLTVAAVIMTIFVSVSAMADEPTIDGVMVQQRWPWSRLVDIDYVIDCDLEQSVDITVQAYNGNNLLDLPEASFSGDLNGVSYGARRIVWDPTLTAYTNNGVLPKFCVELTPTPTPLYMIVDLTKSVGEAGQIEYVYESDLTNGLWGAWVRNPVTNRGSVVESVVWTGVVTNDIYKTDKLVLRRISRGTFNMGGAVPPTLATTLTKDFYAGVFEVTQWQWELLMGAKPSSFKNPAYYATRPVEYVSYDNIRGTEALGGAGWPTNDSVYAASFVGLLCAKTGLADFDLPTEAQWEYACRAGTDTCFNDGDALANVIDVNSRTNVWLNALGRHRFGDGYIDGVTKPMQDCSPTNGTAIVGSYLPNAWGLYDMHGNVLEWCLDWHDSLLQGGENPKGAESSENRVFRGGSWYDYASSCYSAHRNKQIPSALSYNRGFRIVRTLP
ncbi:MAG: formylglycine-generating enzyme family protein [Kiritimatiellia bacterium]